MTHLRIPQSRLFHLARSTPMLEASQEIELVARAQAGCKRAMHELVCAYMRLIVSLSVPFQRNTGVDAEDLIHEGTVGLMHAISRFDPNVGVRLGTYARHWIKERLAECTRKDHSLVVMGMTHDRRKGIFNLHRIVRKLQQEAYARGERPKQDEIHARAAEMLGISIVNAREILARAGGDVSLNAPLGRGQDGLEASESRQDALVDERADTEQDLIRASAQARRSVIIQGALAHLSARERRIVMDRHLAERPVTLEALGAEFGISKERVRQIEKRALEKMAESLQTHRDEALA